MIILVIINCVNNLIITFIYNCLGDLDNRDLMIKRDNVGDLDSPKHGKLDPNNAPHIGKILMPKKIRIGPPQM